MSPAASDRAAIHRGSGNVFADLGFDAAEAKNLELRAQLMSAISSWFEGSGLSQVAASKRLGVAQPRLNAALRGDIDACSLDWLVNVAVAAGLTVRLTVERARSSC